MVRFAKFSAPLYHALRENTVQNFQDQVVIITGASSGIGRETALAFATAGARVVAAARREALLQELAGPRVLPVVADITKDEDVHRLVETTISRFGRVDILVNNAGSGMRALVEQVQLADAHRLMELNFFGALRCIQAVLPHMKRQGRGQIVNVSSVIGVVATPRNSIYCASKFALRALSDSLRMELREAGIEVISILPGYTDTPFFDQMIRYGGPRRVTRFRGQHPRKVAAAILKACRRHNREVTLTMAGKVGCFAKRVAPRVVDFFLQRST
jgi:NAD(P)-dependent dehydrogenase (short-subunit alcohol dehydrogenase family)